MFTDADIKSIYNIAPGENSAVVINDGRWFYCCSHRLYCSNWILLSTLFWTGFGVDTHGLTPAL